MIPYRTESVHFFALRKSAIKLVDGLGFGVLGFWV